MKRWGAFFLLAGAPLVAVDISNEVQLQTKLNAGISPITFQNTINRTPAVFPLRPVNSSDDFLPAFGPTTTINGNGFSYVGASFRGFLARSMETRIENLHFSNCQAHGGDGGSSGWGGGAGGGMGGALFVYTGATVIVENCTFDGCSAIGGNGGVEVSSANSSGGGGSMNGRSRTAGGDAEAGNQAGGGGGGYGGSGGAVLSGCGGGGGGGLATPGGDAVGGPAGAGGLDFGAGFSGGAGGLGSGGSDAFALGGGGGGGGGVSTLTSGGEGGSAFFTGVPPTGFAGGGGGGSPTSLSGLPVNEPKPGGDGSFGGGGGGAVLSDPLFFSVKGGRAGFGGGGGAPLGVGGFGGALAGTTIGGGGAGFGGAIFLMEGGSLILADSISFSGNSVAAGQGGFSPLPAQEGGTDIYMMAGSDLTFELTSNLVLQHPIEGTLGVGVYPFLPVTTGFLEKAGPATVVLTGDNTYTSMTNVCEGELRIMGSTTTDIEVTGGTLSGQFKTVENAMTLTDGNITVSVGSVSLASTDGIQLAGSYSQSGGVLVTDLSPHLNDNLYISPSTPASLTGGTYTVFLGQGVYIPGTEYVIIDSLTPDDQFPQPPTVTGPMAPFVTLQAFYGDQMTVVIESSQFFPIFPPNNGPNRAIVNCFEGANIDPNSDLAKVLRALGSLSSSALNTALTTLTTNDFTALEWINARNRSRIANVLDQHQKECICFGSGWVSVFGVLGEHRKRYDNLRPFDSHSINVAVGFDHLACDCISVGGAFIWTGTDFKWKDGRGKGNLSGYTGAFYASGSWCNFSAYFSAQGGATQNALKRRILFAEIDRTGKSTFWSPFATGHLQLTYDWSFCNWMLTPYTLADYHFFHRDAFREHGAASLNLIAPSKNQHSMRTEAGLYLTYCCECIRPYLGLSWIGEFPINKSRENASLKGAPECQIEFTSYSSLFQFASPTLGFRYNRCGNSFLAEYKGIFNNRTIIHQIEARWEWTF